MCDATPADVTEPDMLWDAREREIFRELNRLRQRSEDLIEKAARLTAPREFLHRFPLTPPRDERLRA